MLIYHPAYDVNHCLYRFLLILESSTQDKFDWEAMKLLDFFLLFPHLLKQITPMPASLRSFKAVIKQLPDAYEVMPNPKRVLFDLAALQNTAMMNLVAKGLIDTESFHKKVIKRSSKELPPALNAQITENPIRSEEWFRLIVNELPQIEYNGPNGLKKRSGLLEFKYDVVG